MRVVRIPISVSCGTVTSILVLASSPCFAQWLPPPGEGSVSVVYQYTHVTKHLFSVDVDGITDPTTGYVGGPGKQFYLGDIYGQTVNVAADYGVWKGLAVSGTASYLTSKYKGRAPESASDDGQFHGSLQDATAAVQYMLRWNDFAITPSVGARIPLKDYDTIGHVSVGRGLSEFPLGLSVGRSLDPVLPRAFLAASYTYSIVENHEGHSLDQHLLGLNGGYLVSARLSLGGFLQYLDTVDGIDWWNDIDTEQEFHAHDVAAAAKYLRAGISAGYRLGRGFGVRVSYTGTLSGENTHAANSVSIAPTWSFGAPFSN